MRLLDLVNALDVLDPNLVFRNGFKGAFRNTQLEAAVSLQCERDVPVRHMYMVLRTIDGVTCSPSHPAHNRRAVKISDDTPCYLVRDPDSVGSLVTNQWFQDELEFAILREEYQIARSLLDHLSEWVRRTERYGTSKKIEDDRVVLSAPAPDLNPTARYVVNWGTLKIIHGWVTGQYKKGV